MVYPVAEVDQELVEFVETIEGAYNFWGKIVIGSVVGFDKTFFPGSLSYPYKFSDQGAQILRQRLEGVPEIDVSTITEKIFPNIPQDQLYVYTEEEKKTFLIEEKYISFKLKEWDNIEFMKFPTFVVLAFDHTGESSPPATHTATMRP